MEKNQEISITVCQELSKDVSSNVSSSVPDFMREYTQIPPIEEENWDDNNHSTYIPNLDRDIIRGPLIGKSK
ncbi:hypothetical protein JTB14_022384 [Gonioctena quinquepunctata]|nr:hypothetical protein JTB14_022384 [Gonioctena quinquepunctata]